MRMSNIRALKRTPKPHESEVVDAGNRKAEIVAVLRHYLARAQSGDEFTGMMLILETEGGGYITAQSGTSNVAQRLGRLELLKQDVLDLALDSGDGT